MKEKKIVIERKNIDKKEFYHNFLKLLSTTYPNDKKLTNAEREVLVEFMLLPERFKYNRFSTDARKRVTTSLGKGANTKYIINNYLDILRTKKYLIKDADNIECLHPVLDKIIDLDGLELNFKFVINGTNS